MKLKLRMGGPTEDLFALDDTRFHLLVFGQPSSGMSDVADADLLDVHDVPLDPANETALDRAHIPRPSFYLLRPDGHVGLCGTVFDAVACRYMMSVKSPQGPLSSSRAPIAAILRLLMI